MTLADNPVYTRLTRHARWPSLRVTFWLALALGVVMLVGVAEATFRVGSGILTFPGRVYAQPHIAFAYPNEVYRLWHEPLDLTVYALLILPPVMALIGAVVTARDTQIDDFNLLRLTNQYGRDIARGFLWAVLFRARLMLALYGSVAVFFFLPAGYATALTFDRGINLALAPGSDQFLIAVPWAVVILMASMVMVLINLVGAAILGAAVGVWMGLMLRNTGRAAAVAAGIIIFLLAITAALYLAGNLPTTGLDLAKTFILAACPWLLISTTLRLAGRAYDQGNPR